MNRLLTVIVVALFAGACGSSSPTAPSTPKVAGRIITITGSLDFGNVNIGDSAERTFTVGDSGSDAIAFTSLSCQGGTGSTGYTASPTSGTIPAGGSVTITVHFAPTVAQFYSCVLHVVGNQTGGNDAINIGGTGINNNPVFTRSGTGDTVFDMPTYVSRIRIIADFAGGAQNFIVHIGGSGVVNELMGRDFSETHFDGTYVTHGGTVEIISSSGVLWSFGEVR